MLLLPVMMCRMGPARSCLLPKISLNHQESPNAVTVLAGARSRRLRRTSWQSRLSASAFQPPPIFLLAPMPSAPGSLPARLASELAPGFTFSFFFSFRTLSPRRRSSFLLSSWDNQIIITDKRPQNTQRFPGGGCHHL